MDIHSARRGDDTRHRARRARAQDLKRAPPARELVSAAGWALPHHRTRLTGIRTENENHDHRAAAIRCEQDNDGIVTPPSRPGPNRQHHDALYLDSLRARWAARTPRKTKSKASSSPPRKDLLRGRGPHAPHRSQARGFEGDLRTVEETQRHLRALEDACRTVVAALNGNRARRRVRNRARLSPRIAIDDPNRNRSAGGDLGLLPGSGGVVRHGAAAGPAKALVDVLLQGTRFRPAKAKEVGSSTNSSLIVQRCSPKRAEFILAPPAANKPWDESNYKMGRGTPSTLPSPPCSQPFPANLTKQIKGANYPAPKPSSRGCRGSAGRLRDRDPHRDPSTSSSSVTGKVAKNMMKAFFFDLQKSNAGASRPRTVPPGRPKRSACSVPHDGSKASLT